jgi:hypothetical protein
MLVNLRRVGIQGLRAALAKADASGLGEREAILDFLVAELKPRNYIPESVIDHYRDALWREWMRHRGEDLRPFHSPLPVVVRGEVGEARDRFVETLGAVLGEFELRPEVAHEPPAEGEKHPALLIEGDPVIAGTPSHREMKKAIHARISDW